MDETVEQLVSILLKFADDTNMGKRVTMDKKKLQEALWVSEQMGDAAQRVQVQGHIIPTPDSATPWTGKLQRWQKKRETLA